MYISLVCVGYLTSSAPARPLLDAGSARMHATKYYSASEMISLSSSVSRDFVRLKTRQQWTAREPCWSTRLFSDTPPSPLWSLLATRWQSGSTRVGHFSGDLTSVSNTEWQESFFTLGNIFAVQSDQAPVRFMCHTDTDREKVFQQFEEIKMGHCVRSESTVCFYKLR